MEKIPREAMDSVLRKSSMIVHTAKAACNKTRGCGSWTHGVLLAMYKGDSHT